MLNGGTGATTSTGSGSVVLANSPTFVGGLSITAPGAASATLSTALVPALLAGNTVTQTVGRAASLNNSWTTQFVYNSAGSNTNYFGVGLTGNTETIRVHPSGTAATSPTVAAAEITGGFGVSEAIYAGTSINLTSAATTSFTCGSWFAPSLVGGNGITKLIGVANTTNNCGTIQFVYTGSGSTSNFFALGLAGANTLFISPAGTVATSTVTGAVRVTGGLGVTGDIYCTNIFGNLTGSISQTLLTVSNPTVSAGLFQIGSILTPSLGAGGGCQIVLGVSTSVNGNGMVGTFVYIGSGSASNFYGTSIVGSTYSTKVFAANTASTSTTTGTLLVTGGLGVSGTINVAALNVISGATTNATITTEYAGALGAGQALIKEFGVDTLASNNSVRQVFGYVGSGSALNSWAFQFFNVGTTMLLRSPGTVSTSTTTGALILTGGLGVSGNIYGTQMSLGGGALFAYSETALTPTMSGASGAITGLTYTLQTGTAVRIGRMVYVYFSVTFSYTVSPISNNMVMSFGGVIPTITGGSGTCNTEVSNIAGTPTPYVITPLGTNTFQFWSGVNPLQWQTIANTNQRLNGMFTYLT